MCEATGVGLPTTTTTASTQACRGRCASSWSDTPGRRTRPRPLRGVRSPSLTPSRRSPLTMRDARPGRLLPTGYRHRACHTPPITPPRMASATPQPASEPGASPPTRGAGRASGASGPAGEGRVPRPTLHRWEIRMNPSLGPSTMRVSLGCEPPLDASPSTTPRAADQRAWRASPLRPDRVGAAGYSVLVALRSPDCGTFGAGTVIDGRSRSPSLPCGTTSRSPDPREFRLPRISPERGKHRVSRATAALGRSNHRPPCISMLRPV